jgi:outer membrane protein OmpA-like peptidoglycan-associated protein
LSSHLRLGSLWHEDSFREEKNVKKTSFLLIALLLGVFALQSCTSNPYTGQKQTSKTAWGAIIGGAAGAAAGAATGKDSEARRKRALIGAGAGALAGGGVGYYMDRQEAQLRQRLQNTGVSVNRQGDRIELIMPGNITFDTDSSDIKPNFYDVLNSVALVLKEYNKTLINITGHTDNTGTAEYNQGLSQRRAQSVGQYLISQGVDPTRVAAQGMGLTQPIAGNDTPEGRQQNRRVQVELAPLTTGQG